MRKTLALGMVMLALPALQAGELGILAGKQIGKAQAIAAGGSGNYGAGSYDAVSPTGFGVRAGFSILDLKVAELGAAVTYQPKAKGDLSLNDAVIGKYSNEYIAVGLQADWKFLVNLHLGADMRSEKLVTDIGGTTESTTVTRPWVKAGVGFSAPLPIVSPFVRLEVAVPVSTTSKTETKEDFRKAMAPSIQVALYGGIRF